ncbi:MULTISPECIES: hypothetical protein [Lactobacillus]|uniref:hypothetical protein n=1 Tax=Lactobacillus TaxID=1578 RepID=UPI00129E3C9A|nr:MULTISPECIES: hypothetical protein [Lactobacillus]MRM99233.1 hypothetical protein [Lactobacillus taiwanensis]
MIVFDKNSIYSTNYKGIEDFWISYKQVELFVWKNISKVGFDAKLKTMIAKNHMQLSVVLTDNEYLIVYFLFKNDILIPLKIKKSEHVKNICKTEMWYQLQPKYMAIQNHFLSIGEKYEYINE